MPTAAAAVWRFQIGRFRALGAQIGFLVYLKADDATPPTPVSLSLPVADTAHAPDVSASGGGREALLRRGAAIGRYVVITALGSGGMGAVYGAYDPELDRKVAVKLLHAHASGTPGDGGARLLREAQAMAKLSHPNVVTVHDVGTSGGRVYLAMEYVAGATLRRWLRGQRSWRRLLDVFRRAGDGLTAAHAKGLVHRDFKPDNVMVGDDGRVRVMDFGLARTQSTTPVPNPIHALDEATPESGRAVLSTRLTQRGAVMGTPAYMAPEQWAGAPADARTDQFAFCVALWEALHGRRPFAGATPGELAFNVTEGRLEPAPHGAVPRWLVRTLERGMAKEPSDRFGSMRELMAVLDRGQTRRRSRMVYAALGALFAVGGSVEGTRRYRQTQRVEACDRAGDEIYELWNADTRARVREAMLSTELTYAPAAADAVMPWLDTWTESWRAERVRACSLDEPATSTNAELAAKSIECLEDRRTRVEATLEALLEPTEAVVRRAVSVVSGLPRVGPCGEPRYLALRPSVADADRSDVLALRRLMSQAGSLSMAARYDDALEVSEQALELASGLGNAALVADARLQRGWLLDHKGDYAAAEAEVFAAYLGAGAAGAPEVTALAATRLVYVVGWRQARHAEARVWAAAAEVAVHALESEAGLRTSARLNALAAVDFLAGQYAKAEIAYSRSLEISERIVGPEHPRVANALTSLGSVLTEAGRSDEAEPLLRRALDIKEATMGPEHPSVATTLTNLANVQDRKGRYFQALALLERVLAIRERTLGPDHAQVGRCLANLAATFTATRDYDRARQFGRRALAIIEKRFGPRHPEVATALHSLAIVSRRTGEYQEAIALNERVLEITKAALGSNHPEMAPTLSNLAAIHYQLGAFDEAAALYQRAIGIWESSNGTDDPAIAGPLATLADIALAAGRPADAVPLAARALAISEDGQAPTDDLARSQLMLAQALWLAPLPDRDRTRALALATRAKSACETGRCDPTRPPAIDAWLEKREHHVAEPAP